MPVYAGRVLRALLLVVLLVSCKPGGSKPAAEGAGSSSVSAAPAGSGAGSGSAVGSVVKPASAGFARPLRGPFATLDAYCATRPRTDDHTCEVADVTPAGALPAGLLQAAAIYENNDGPNHDVGCAVALRTSAGWFVGPPSAETCREPSYTELAAIELDTDEAIAAISFAITWHTKNGEDEAKYKLTALCTAAPACTPVFLSQCDARAPAAGCADASFALTWTLDGRNATFQPDRKIDNDTVPTGKQTLAP
jgi:hypothetical protein